MTDRYASLKQGLVGCWIPSVSGSGLLLPDLSGRNNNGSLVGMDASDWVSASYGRALDFDGVDDIISVTRRPTIYDIANIGAISCWIYARSFDGNDGGTPRTNINDIMGPDVIGGTREWNIGSASDSGITTTAKFGFIMFGSGGGYITCSTTNRVLETDKWLHIVLTKTSNSFAGLTVYLNGVSQALTDASSGTFGTPNSSTTQALSIGRRTGQLVGQDLFWNGQIDDIRLYSRALTESEVKLLASRPGIGLRQESHRNTFYQFPSGARRKRILTGMP